MPRSSTKKNPFSEERAEITTTPIKMAPLDSASSPLKSGGHVAKDIDLFKEESYFNEKSSAPMKGSVKKEDKHSKYEIFDVEKTESNNIIAKKPSRKRTTTTEGKKRTKVVVTKELLEEKFDEMEKMLETEMEKYRRNGEKGNKFLKSLNKKMKEYHRLSVRGLTAKVKTKRVVDPNRVNGFSKETAITRELATFLDLDPNDKYSRTFVNKKIFAYIKEKKLNAEADKRRIEPDIRFNRLLEFCKQQAPKVDRDYIAINGLNYFSMQKLLKHCFIKE